MRTRVKQIFQACLLLPVHKCQSHWMFSVRFIGWRKYASSKLNRTAIIWYVVTYVAGNFRYNATLNFPAFRSKFEAIDEVMSHLTCTRKRYNPGEAPWGIGRCRRVWERMSRDVTLPSCSSGWQLCPSTIILWSLPRAVLALSALFSSRIILFECCASMQSTWNVSDDYCGWFLKERPHEHTVESPLRASFPIFIRFFLDCGRKRSKHVPIATSRWRSLFLPLT